MLKTGCGWRLERTHPSPQEPGGPLAGWKMQALNPDIGLINMLEEVGRVSTLSKFLLWLLQQHWKKHSGQGGPGTCYVLLSSPEPGPGYLIVVNMSGNVTATFNNTWTLKIKSQPEVTFGHCKWWISIHFVASCFSLSACCFHNWRGAWNNAPSDFW